MGGGDKITPMTPGEQRVKIAAKLYQCRDTAKRLYGEKYQEMIATYKDFIRAYMIKNSESNELDAAIGLCNEYDKKGDNGMFIMKVMAAAVEIAEPS